MDWLPASAALLLTGALALCLGTFLLPSTDSTTQTLRVVEQHDGRWLAVAVIYFLASVCLTLGLPSVLTLFSWHGRGFGLASAVALEVGFLGIAGYAMLMVFFRSLVVTQALRGHALDDVAHETGLRVFLYGWVVGFVVGELLLAVALLQARSTPIWVPLTLFAHVVSVPLSDVMPDVVAKGATLLMVAAYAGIAIQVTARPVPQVGARQPT